MWHVLPEIEDHHDLVVCGRCGRLRGPWRNIYRELSAVQRCGCDGQPDDARWPKFDFNCVGELCRSCGRECLESGSRWSVWFCADCKEYVRQVHAQAGRYLIPIGRHSTMSGFGVQSGSIALGLPSSWHFDRELIEKFAKRWNSVSDRMNTLVEWSRLIVKDNLMGMGLSSAESIRLAEYLRAAAKLQRTKKEIFWDMCQFLDLNGKRVNDGTEE